VQPGAPLIVDAKSGVSGAGRKPSLGTHFVEVYGDFKPYNIGRVHRHTGEIEQELRANADFELGPLIFSPHLLPIDRGLLATCYVPLAEGWTFEGARALVEGQYEDEPLVDVLPEGETARIAAVSRQNGAQISLHRATEDLMIVVCALDNLLKGASSQALQNANLLCGLDETAGLI
jgi:N-acetyl-gamma-glutamyl-phosphate reductase